MNYTVSTKIQFLVSEIDSLPFGQHDYDSQTVMNPMGLMAIVLLGTAMLFVPRRYAVWPMIIMGCFVAPAQRLAIFTLNFDLLRLMVIFGMVRVGLRHEWKNFHWKSLDTITISFALMGASIYVLQYGTWESVKYKLGSMYDIVGLYILFRCLVRTLDDLAFVALGFAIVSVPVFCSFVMEYVSGRNMFSVFGGVPDITEIREGRLRCQGAFAHPILAGCYWAGVLPLIAALWWQKGSRRQWAVIGVGCSALIIILCASSTPIVAVGFVVVGTCVFPFRRYLHALCWIGVGGLLMLQLVMKAPAWSLVYRVPLVGGSTGWHRYVVVDQFLAHFDDWWLLGTKSVEGWGIWKGDITNEYLLAGARGGIWTLALLVILVLLGFAFIGRLCKIQETKAPNLALSWGLGLSFGAHCVSFLGVNYFGQISMLWYLTLAVIASVGPKRVNAANGSNRLYALGEINSSEGGRL